VRAGRGRRGRGRVRRAGGAGSCRRRGGLRFLGLDPTHVANEGKLVAFVAPEAADDVLAAMRDHPYGRDAVLVGEVVDDHAGIVVARTGLGAKRVVDLPLGEQLPRIC
jgi:hydrogenase expression/formation protein HypE